MPATLESRKEGDVGRFAVEFSVANNRDVQLAEAGALPRDPDWIVSEIE